MDMLSLTWFFSVYIMKWKDTWLEKSCREEKLKSAFVCLCEWPKKKDKDLRIKGVAIQLATSYRNSLQII